MEDKIIQGLRTDYPELKDYDVDVLVDAVKEVHFQDLDDSTYHEALKETYGVVPEKKSMLGQVTGFLKENVIDPYTSPARAVGALGAQGLKQPMQEMEQVGYQDLIARGYSPQIAQHVMKQRIATQQEMAAEMQMAGETGQRETIEGAATYGSTVIGMGIDQRLGSRLASKGLQGLMKHAISGAGGIGSYEGVKAIAEDKSASEVLDAILSGVKTGAIAGPVIGGVAKGAGAVMGAIAKPFADKLTRPVGSIQRYVEKPGSTASMKMQATLIAQADRFADNFKPDWLRTRFSDLMTDPMTGAELPPTVIAANIISKILGQDVAENASESAVGRIAERIKAQRRFSGIDPSIEPRVTKPSDPVQGLEGMTTDPMSGQPMPEPTPREALDMIIAQEQMQEQIAQTSMLPQGAGGMAPEPNVIGESTQVPGMEIPGNAVQQDPRFGPVQPGLEGLQSETGGFTPPNPSGYAIEQPPPYSVSPNAPPPFGKNIRGFRGKFVTPVRGTGVSPNEVEGMIPGIQGNLPEYQYQPGVPRIKGHTPLSEGQQDVFGPPQQEMFGHKKIKTEEKAGHKKPEPKKKEEPKKKKKKKAFQKKEKK